MNKSSTPLEYKGYLYVDDESSAPLQELTFKINTAATGITSSFHIGLEPSKKYTIFIPKGQIMPKPFDNVVNEYSDTSNGDIYLNFYTPAVETIPTVALVDDGKEFTASDLEGKMRFDLVPFMFDNEQYRINKRGNWYVADLYEIGNATPIAQFDYDVIYQNGESYIELAEDVSAELLNGKEYELVFDAGSMGVISFGNFYEYTFNPRFVIKYKGETATEHTLVIKSSDGHSTKAMVTHGKDVTYQYKAPEGRSIVNATLKFGENEATDITEEMKENGVYTIPAIKADAELNVTLNVVEPEVVYVQPEHVNVNLSVGDHVAVAHKVAKAQDAVVNVVPTENWILSQLILNDTDVTEDISGNGDYTIPAASLAEDANLKAEFAYNGTPMFDFTAGVNTVVGCDYRVYSDNSDLVIENIPANAHVAVYSVNGLLISEENNHGDTDTVRISLNPGVYVVIINNDALKVRHQ